ncbi:MAG: endonuclease Q family protein, partial [Candidatus Bathyarchaeales archaeon]
MIADLHIHSRYSRATSQKMCIEEIARFARIKGLNLVGTGDFTHPKWLKELQEVLVEEQDTGLYKVAKNPESPVNFMITTEVSTIFTFENEVKKVHHVILTPSIETAVQINETLTKYGDLSVDGRPTLNMDAPRLVEEVMEVSSENMVFPAHAWTPWFSVFGAFSGFNSLEDCYQDMTKHIYALETGLSSDPPMNWRLSKLDRFTLVSNSDSHSLWPWRIGREANVFELKRPSYREVADAIRLKDKERFKFTIETNPAYGKYHWTGHRNCNVALSPQEA